MKNASALAALTIAAAFSTPAISGPFDEVFAGASACMDSINQQALAAQAESGEGEINLFSVPYVHAKEERTNTSYSQDAITQYVPAITATYLDGNVPGAAWSECMQAKGLPTPDLPLE
ncbi:hypothetical protein [Billgrantia bachuensis]|uniref:Uncharacterized protein n=1 Tax=Billgrantia bachuensis TaxID=2717286 RepID=A0ABX0PQ59_9GAMM|nr:hypothetical protein [Halomonas bachuensis]NIC05253.1 hypothetical protein [Halomonas bachuensis]